MTSNPTLYPPELRSYEWAWHEDGQRFPFIYSPIPGAYPDELIEISSRGTLDRPFWQYTVRRNDQTLWTNRYFATVREAREHALQDMIRPHAPSLRHTMMIRDVDESIVDGVDTEAFIMQLRDGRWWLEVEVPFARSTFHGSKEDALATLLGWVKAPQ